MDKLIVTGLVFTVGVIAITVMQMNALAHGMNGTVLMLSIMVVGSMVAGFCGFSLKEVWNWWRGK